MPFVYTEWATMQEDNGLPLADVDVGDLVAAQIDEPFLSCERVVREVAWPYGKARIVRNEAAGSESEKEPGDQNDSHRADGNKSKFHLPSPIPPSNATSRHLMTTSQICLTELNANVFPAGFSPIIKRFGCGNE